MRPSLQAVFAVGVLGLFVACGDGKPAPTDSVSTGGSSPGGGGQGQGGSSSSPCNTYCGFIQTHGTGCEQYQAKNNCTWACGTYLAGPCKDLWLTFHDCVMNSPSISCASVASGKLALTTEGCGAERSALDTCVVENDAGICD